MYRMQVYDGQTTGMHWQRQKVAAEHLRERLARGRRQAMQCGRVDVMAIDGGRNRCGATLGVPQITLARSEASAWKSRWRSAPIRRRRFRRSCPRRQRSKSSSSRAFCARSRSSWSSARPSISKCRRHAEIVLEGYVELDELRTEGPFGDHTGFYTMQEDYPVFHITCITHRKDPDLCGDDRRQAADGRCVDGQGGGAHLPAADAADLPEIVDVNLPVEGVFHNLMIVSIRKSYAGQARKVMNGIWAMGQAMFTKCIIVVDEDCDVQDLGEVTLRVANNIDPERDIQFTLGPIDSLDHASRLPNYGSKMGIDATRKWTAEGFTRPWPQMMAMDPDDQGARGCDLEEAGIGVSNQTTVAQTLSSRQEAAWPAHGAERIPQLSRGAPVR